jgi:phosphate ABC transporter phosphate-binding protein
MRNASEPEWDSCECRSGSEPSNWNLTEQRIPFHVAYRNQALWSSPRLACLRPTFSFLVFLVLILAYTETIPAQTAETLSQVKKVYVEPFGQESAANKLRDRTIEQLRRKGKLEVVSSQNQADAVIKGSAGVWVTGYVSTDPRSPSNARQPISHGFLSVEVIGKHGEPLWSYLVTPSKFRTGDITKDLADHLVAKLAAALEQNSENSPVSPTAEAIAETTLTAAGATFPAPLYQKWFEVYQQRRPNINIKYDAVGSEAGLRLLQEGKVDFAASDMPLSDESMAQSKRTVIHFASVIGAVVPVYNLKGVNRNLRFTPKILAAIYLGKIRKWNDPAIRKSNRDTALPDADIVVVHRSDGSGTTFVWTDYLSKLSPEWKAAVGVGSRVSWPIGTSAQGNDGVATMVQQTPNAIGYVEFVYALRHQLSFGAVQNAAGQFILADLPSMVAAAAHAVGARSSDSRVSITNAPGRNAYPIATFTWWLWPQGLASDSKRTAFRELLEWMLSSGQKECSALGYAPLPREVANQELQLLGGLN